MDYVGFIGRRNEVLVCTFADVQRIDHDLNRGTLKYVADVVNQQGLTTNPVPSVGE